MSGLKSRNKGKRGERAWAKHLTKLGFEARRGVQYQGGPGSPDVVCPSLSSIHFEVKFGYGGMDIGTDLLAKALDQAEREKRPGTIAVVAWRPPRRCWRISYRSKAGVVVTVEAEKTILERLNCTVPVVTA